MNPLHQIAIGDGMARHARVLAEHGRNANAEIWMIAAQCYYAVASGRFYGVAAMMKETWPGEFRTTDKTGPTKL